ncbi:unnamed protein product, partial [Ceratitis capitata]
LIFEKQVGMSKLHVYKYEEKYDSKTQLAYKKAVLELINQSSGRSTSYSTEP